MRIVSFTSIAVLLLLVCAAAAYPRHAKEYSLPGWPVKNAPSEVHRGGYKPDVLKRRREREAQLTGGSIPTTMATVNADGTTTTTQTAAHAFGFAGGQDQCNIAAQDFTELNPYVFRFTNMLDDPILDAKCYGSSVTLFRAMVDPSCPYNVCGEAGKFRAAVLESIQLAESAGVYGFPNVIDRNNNDTLTLANFYNFMQFDVANWVPLENQQDGKTPAGKSMYTRLSQFYFFFSQEPLKYLQNYPDESGTTLSPLSIWLVNFVQEWGGFLDTEASFNQVAYDAIVNSNAFRMDDYMAPPSGYATYNQFFARSVRPGARPVYSQFDDSVIVAPCDSVTVGQWEINATGYINVNSSDTDRPEVKGIRAFSIDEFLGDDVDQAVKQSFYGGTFTHMFLNVFDYHRLHTPVRGQVLVNKFVSGAVFLNVTAIPANNNTAELPTLLANRIKRLHLSHKHAFTWVGHRGHAHPDKHELTRREHGKRPLLATRKSKLSQGNNVVDALDNTGWQFAQDRGILIQNSPFGNVATCPIGMAQVSRIVPTAPLQTTLIKGEEFSYFKNGGSDLIMLFPNTVDVTITVPWNTTTNSYNHVMQGERWGTVTKRNINGLGSRSA